MTYIAPKGVLMMGPGESVPAIERRGGGTAYAAIDLGTNNCRLLVGVPTAAGFRVVDSYSRIVRLGEGLGMTGRLNEAAMERALLALQACAERLARRPVRGLRAGATEACRQAVNGADFLARARDATGIDIDIIPPREEAELALESCASLLAGKGRRALVFDIGGGSTELAWVRLGGADELPELIGYATFPVGVVNLFERYGPACFDPEGFAGMVADVAARLESFERVHRIRQETRAGGVVMLGTSGTVTTLAGTALELPRYRRPLVDGTILTAADADRALGLLQALGPDGLARHPCIGPDRVDFVLPGCAVFQAIREVWPVGDVIVADRGLREGMLLRLMRRAEGGAGHHGPRHRPMIQEARPQ